MMTELPLDEARRLDYENSTLPRVLLIVDQLARTLGGGERIVLKLASLLPSYGFQPAILTFSAHPESAAIKDPPCPIYVLPLRRTYDLAAFRAGKELRSFLRVKRIEIVQTFFESSDLWGGFVAKSAGTKLIWSRRDMGILRTGKHRVAYRLMAKLPDAVFAVSELVRQHCIEVDRLSPDRVQTIYNGLDLPAWQIKPTEREPSVTVTTVGNIRKVKGHDIFIRAAAEVVKQFPEVRFTVGGEVLEPEYYAQLQALLNELNLAGQFEFVGGVSNLPKHLSTAQLFVLPSRSEGFSNAIVEAMAASLPVVATNVGGNAEAVQDGVTGYIVPSEDSAALSAAILKLLRDGAKAARMGAAGKKRVAEQFTTEAMMQQVTSTYRRLLGRT